VCVCVCVCVCVRVCVYNIQYTHTYIHKYNTGVEYRVFGNHAVEGLRHLLRVIKALLARDYYLRRGLVSYLVSLDSLV